MLLLGTILLIGVLLGLGLGGDLRNLAEARVRLWYLLPLALVIQLAPIPRGDGEVGRYLPFAALLLSLVLIAVVCVVNWGVRGFPTILLGVLLNAAPIALNQGMPVSPEAVVAVGGSLADLPTEIGEKHHVQTAEDQLTMLADVLPIREPFKAVVSVGDLVMWWGVALFVTAAMLGREQRGADHPPTGHRSRPSTRSGSPQ